MNWYKPRPKRPYKYKQPPVVLFCLADETIKEAFFYSMKMIAFVFWSNILMLVMVKSWFSLWAKPHNVSKQTLFFFNAAAQISAKSTVNSKYVISRTSRTYSYNEVFK